MEKERSNELPLKLFLQEGFDIVDEALPFGYRAPKNSQAASDHLLHTFPLNPALASEMGRRLYLHFEAHREDKYGNLCFADNSDLRDEFKISFTTADVLHYIFAVLHSHQYRQDYQKVFNLDFPTLYFPEDASVFWPLVRLGSQLRQVHLLKSIPDVDVVSELQGAGIGVIEAPNYQQSKLFINKTQYFDHFPERAWTFHLGSFRPLQEWLTDRLHTRIDTDFTLEMGHVSAASMETRRLLEAVDELI